MVYLDRKRVKGMNEKKKWWLGHECISLFVLVMATTIFGFTNHAGAMTGAGNPTNPYVIYNCSDLQSMNSSLNSHYILGNNIDCTDTINWDGGQGFQPIGKFGLSFTGSFDGKGYIINQLYIHRPTESYVGLFGYATAPGGESNIYFIRNVGLKNIDVTGGQMVGGLAGYSAITTSKSYTTGEVTGMGGSVGGLIGSFVKGYSFYIIANQVYSTANVTGHGLSVGGLIGISSTSIIDTYATGSVTGYSDYVGGLVGRLTGDAYSSYSSGKVTGTGPYINGLIGLMSGDARVTGYYDKETSGLSGIGTGWTGYSTAQMRTQSTFYAMNFTETWVMDTQNIDGYPKLRNVMELPNNKEPNNPIITNLANDQILNHTNPSIHWAFSDSDPGDYQTAYQIVGSTNGFASYQYDSGVVESGNQWHNMPNLWDGTWSFAVRTRDSKGLWNATWGYARNVLLDTTKPVLTSYQASGKAYNENKFRVNVYGVSDTISGIDKVQFPTWTENKGQDDLIWYDGINAGGGHWYVDIPIANHGSEEGSYITHIYAYDKAGNSANVGTTTIIDQTIPSAVSHAITGAAYVNGKDYWLKPGDTILVTARMRDAMSGVLRTEISVHDTLTSGDEAANAQYNWDTGTGVQLKQPSVHPYKWNHFSYEQLISTWDSGADREATLTLKANPTTQVLVHETQAQTEDFAHNILPWINLDKRIVIDGENPTGLITQSTTDWTNGNVTITATGSDGLGVGMKRIKKPDGTYSPGTTATHVATSNGTYTFVLEDHVGNVFSKDITITNIDKTPPVSATFTASTTMPTNANVGVTITYPVDAITKQYKIGSAGTWTTYTTAVSVLANNTVYARSFDAAGNGSIESTYTVTNIDKTNPTITLNPTSRDWEVADISVGVTLTDTGGSTYKQARYVWTTNTTKPTTGWNSWNTSDTQTLTQSADGIWYLHVEAQDNAGNTSYLYGGMYKVDKTAPTLNVDFSEIIDQEVYSYIGTNKLLFSGVVSENNVENLVDVLYYVETKDSGIKVTDADVLLFHQANNVTNASFNGKFTVLPSMKNGKYTLVVYAKNHLGLTSSQRVDFDVANPVSKPSVTINIHPQPTGTWVNQPTDAYITDSGDMDLLAGAEKKYEVTTSPVYPSTFTNLLPTDRKVTLTQMGVNYLHVQYTLEDGTVISSTAGPYLIDTSVVGTFEVSLTNDSGTIITDWTKEDLHLVIGQPSTTPLSGIVKQYRIENYHTDWQNYTPGTKVSVEGNNRVFARIQTKAGTKSEQKHVMAKIDKQTPTLHALVLEVTNEGTYSAVAEAQDYSSAVKEVKLNTGQVLLKNGNRYSITNLPIKPTSLQITDYAGNVLENNTFLSEPTVVFTAPYTLALNKYREDVHATITGTNDLSYKIGNKLYTCSTHPCTATIGVNGLFTAIHADGIKQTSKEFPITNIDKSTIQLILNGERSLLDPTKLTFQWNQLIDSGKLICREEGISKTTIVGGSTHEMTGKNYTYTCALEAIIGTQTYTSNRITIYPDYTKGIEGEAGVKKRTKTTPIYVEESKTGTSYLINAKSDNFKAKEIPFPENDITKN